MEHATPHVYASHTAELSTAERPMNRNRDRAQAIRGLTAGRQTLYALRLTDGTVKIGCTSNLAQRRRSYPGSEVLAFTFRSARRHQRMARY